jgi:CheY-like chemotaxis protein
LDILLACFMLTPYRCRVCRERFYRFWRPGTYDPPDPVSAPVLVMPPRREASIAILPPLNPLVMPPIDPEPPRPQRPRRTPPAGSKGAPARSAFIERLDLGMRAPQPLPATSPAVLILVSDLSIRKLLRRLIERRGYVTVEVALMSDVAAELANRPTDLLVVDLAEGEAIGMHVLAGLVRAHAGLKILALSEEPLESSEIPGWLRVLGKPFPLDRFTECVDRLLARP